MERERDGHFLFSDELDRVLRTVVAADDQGTLHLAHDLLQEASELHLVRRRRHDAAFAIHLRARCAVSGERFDVGLEVQEVFTGQFEGALFRVVVDLAFVVAIARVHHSQHRLVDVADEHRVADVRDCGLLIRSPQVPQDCKNHIDLVLRRRGGVGNSLSEGIGDQLDKSPARLRGRQLLDVLGVRVVLLNLVFNPVQ